MMKTIGRRKPYTSVGIRRKKCNCGKQAKYQWGICSLAGRYVPVCVDCDIRLNELALAIFGVQDPNILARYVKKISPSNQSST